MLPLWVVGVFVGLLGLCVGSFLNVVLYRLPVQLSIHKPARSFCPACRKPIAWYDNIPVWSWVWLRARCRNCAAPISVQYPLVEAATALLFVLVYHLLFGARARVGLSAPALPADAPLLLAWLVLAAVLLACAAMDLVSYYIDTHVTDFAVIAALVLYALWPRAEFVASSALTPAGAAAAVALIVGGIRLWLYDRKSRRSERPPEADAETNGAPTSGAPSAAGRASPAPLGSGLLAVTVLLALMILLLASHPELADGTGTLSNIGVAGGLAALFVLVVLAGGQRRGADVEIEQELEEERPRARRTVLKELLWLSPALLAGVATYVLVDEFPALARPWRSAVLWPAASSFAPLGGIVYALHGACLGAAAGWILRILFTLALGREAFGVGDIFILAAAGAAAGWDIVLIGLLLSVGLALLGWLLGLLMKTSTLIPFGPWLGLGMIAALWLNRSAAEVAHYYADQVRAAWEFAPHLLIASGGLVLVGAGGALFLARIVRRLVAPED